MAYSTTTEQATHGPAITPPPIQRLLNSTPTDNFLKFLETKQVEYIGRDGLGREQTYVPHTELAKYWTIAKIRDACDSYSEGIATRHRSIKDHYLRVFSTLLSIGELGYFPSFRRNGLSDQKFPDATIPKDWEQWPAHRSMFENFKKQQWMFFPVILDRDILDDTWLPPERILPVRIEATIRERLHNDRASITKVQFHPSCNNLIKVSWRREPNPRPGHCLACCAVSDFIFPHRVTARHRRIHSISSRHITAHNTNKTISTRSRHLEGYYTIRPPTNTLSNATPPSNTVTPTISSWTG